MSSSVLVIAEHHNGKLALATARTVHCAAQLGDVTVAVFTNQSDQIAKSAAQLEGVKTVLTVNTPTDTHRLAAVLAPQIAQLAKDFEYVLIPATTFGKDVLPRVAGLLKMPMISDLMAIVGPRSFQRPIYAGNILATVNVPESCKVLATVRIASFAPAVQQSTEAPIKPISLNAPIPTHTRFIKHEHSVSDRPDLQSANRVVSGGRALGSKESFELIYKLADQLGAAVGASRAAVDAGYVANDLQVGQTGKVIAPDLYIAVGISGAIQHLTGIKDARTIVAINKDPEAPIFEIADFGLVGDLFELVPALTTALQNRSTH